MSTSGFNVLATLAQRPRWYPRAVNNLRPRKTGARRSCCLGCALAILFWGRPIRLQSRLREGTDKYRCRCPRRPNIARLERRRTAGIELRQDLEIRRVVRNDTNPVVQQVLFSGRYQHEFAAIDADEGELDEWNLRRMRLGPRIDAVPQLHASWRGRTEPAGTRPVLRAVYRPLPAVEQERHIRDDGRKARRAVYDGWVDILQGAPRDRPKQPDQQHLVSAGVHSWRQRFRQAGPVGLSCRRVLVGETNREFGELNAGVFTLGVIGYDFAQTARREGSVACRQLRVSAPRSENTFTRQLEHIVSVTSSSRRTLGRANGSSRCLGLPGSSDLWARWRCRS